MTVYSNKPNRFLTAVSAQFAALPATGIYCAGFELKAWRCEGLADHLMEWIADYALKEDELRVDHGNMYVRLREAAARIYTSGKYQSRGEVGEILLHAICRDFFETIPFAPRVFYLTASNDVVKSFDLVHVRYTPQGKFELWLGEAKFYANADEAILSALASISAHIDAGFLKNQKLLLGPQVSKDVPRYQEIRELLSVQTSLDKLFESAVFPVCIACDSDSAASSTGHDGTYSGAVQGELDKMVKRIVASGLTQKIRLLLLYVPLGSKSELATAFDKRLKGVS